MPEHTQESSPVFFAKGSEIGQGSVVGNFEPNVSVRTQTSPDTTITRGLHNSEVFTPTDMLRIGQDLLSPIVPGDEKHVDQAVAELLADPDSRAELIIRMGAEAISRFMGAERSQRDLGIRSVEELIGDPDDIGSNQGRIRELFDGIAHDGYSAGFRSSLELARPTKDAKLLPDDEQTKLASEMADINKKVLDHLYEEYGVNYGEARIVEKVDPTHRKIVTVYPAAEGTISFVETAYYDRDIAHPMPVDAQGFGVDVIVGVPSYTEEQGYTPYI